MTRYCTTRRTKYLNFFKRCPCYSSRWRHHFDFCVFFWNHFQVRGKKTFLSLYSFLWMTTII